MRWRAAANCGMLSGNAAWGGVRRNDRFMKGVRHGAERNNRGMGGAVQGRHRQPVRDRTACSTGGRGAEAHRKRGGGARVRNPVAARRRPRGAVRRRCAVGPYRVQGGGRDLFPARAGTMRAERAASGPRHGGQGRPRSTVAGGTGA